MKGKWLIMKKANAFAALFLLAALFVAMRTPVEAGVVTGQVIESVASAGKSYTPASARINYALVTIEGTNFQTYSSSSGSFAFPSEIPEGVYNIGVYKDGYYLDTKRVTVGRNPINLVFVLTRKKSTPPTEASSGPSYMSPGYISDALYVAFSEIAIPGSPGSSKSSRNTAVGSNMTSMQFKAAIAAGADVTTLHGMPTPVQDYDKINPANGGDYYTPISKQPNTVAVVDPYSPKNTSFVTMNTKPYWVCFDNSGSKVFISTDTQYIHVMDVNAGNKIIGTIPTGGIVTDITRAPDGNVYASVSGSRAGVLVINPLSNSASAFYPVKAVRSASDAQPRAIAVGSKYIYVALGTNSAGEVLALNKAGGAILGSCPVGPFPSGMCVTPNGKYVFVANRNGGTVSVLDAERLALLGSARVGSQPTKVVSSPTGDKIYVTNFGSNYLSVLDGRTCATIATVATGKGPLGLGISADGTRVFVSNNIENNISIINAEVNSVVQTTTPSTTSKPFGLAVRPGGMR